MCKCHFCKGRTSHSLGRLWHSWQTVHRAKSLTWGRPAQCFTVLICGHKKPTLTLVNSHPEPRSSPHTIFLLKKPLHFLVTDKRSSNFQSNLLVANLPSLCTCTTNHFNIHFSLPVVNSHAGITKTCPHFSLRSRQQNFRNCS